MLAPRRQLAPFILALACRSALPVAPGDAGADSATPPPIVPSITLPDDHGGSRLKLAWWTAPGGASVPGGITDSQLGVSCSWARLEDGFHCVPPRERPIRYADPACTQPLLVHDSRHCIAVPDYVSVPANPPTCPPSTGLRRRGARVQPAATYSQTVLGCTMLPVPEGLEVYEVGEPVPPSTFVAATAVIEPLADGWSRVYLDAEDGSRWVQSLRRGAVDCAVARAADGLLRCLPQPAGSVNEALLDADCATPVAEGDRSSCSAAESFVWDSRAVACPRRVSVRRASRRLDSSYLSVNGTCRPRQDPFRDVYAVGDELPPGDFPAVTRAVLDAPGRLERQVTSISAGTYGISSFWDSMLGFRCAPLLAQDGTHRCAPTGTALATAPVFSDPQCTRPVTTADPCVISVLLTPVADLCPERDRIFRIGAVTTVEKPYVLEAGGGCVPAGPAVPTSAVFHAVEELRPADLVELSLTP